MTSTAKKSLITIAVIVLLIILAHAIVLKFFWGGSSAEPVKEETVEAVEPAKPAFRYKVPSENPLFGTPFNYSEAVNGNISEIPSSQKARSGILVDLNTRKVLWAKNPRNGVPIASMVKMMTLLLAMETIEANPTLSLESMVQVSPAASKIGGSQVYLDPKESFPIGQLLKAVTIKSANDAAYLVAEFLSGNDVASFVALMNNRAAALGMTNTKYINPNGLSAGKVDSISSAEGMAILAEHILEFPNIIEWSSAKQADFREVGTPGWQSMTNTNGLIKRGVPGVDGLKTGYIRTSGFCLTATCLRGGRRLVGVVTGFDSARNRDAFMEQLLNWGYRRAAQLDGGAQVAVPASSPVAKSGGYLSNVNADGGKR